MKARKVFEIQEFKRGEDPKQALGVGILQKPDPSKRNDASYRYEVQRNHIDFYLKEIKESLRDMDDSFDGHNWGYIGSLDHVRSELKDLYIFLTGNEDIEDGM